MRYPRHAFAPGCATKSWCVPLRKGSPTRTETLSREWWLMNDESLIRLRQRKSKHGSVSEPARQLQKHLAAPLMHLQTMGHALLVGVPTNNSVCAVERCCNAKARKCGRCTPCS